jgi:hypothetical protein
MRGGRSNARLWRDFSYVARANLRTRSISFHFGLYASQRFVGCQLQFAKLVVRKIPNAVQKTAFGNGSHLKGKSYRRLTQTILRCFDHRRAGESRALEVRGQRDDQDGLQCSREGVTLPNDYRPPAGLLSRPIRAQICPPDLAALQLRSSLRSAVSHSPRPASVRVSSSATSFDKRARSHRERSGRRTTTSPTLSPGRNGRWRIGRRTPSLNSASITSMRQR